MSDFLGFGVILEWDPAGGTSFTPIGQINDITPPGPSRDSVEKTTHNSPDRWKESMKGLKSGGQVSFDVNYDPALATHNASTGVLSDFDEDAVIPNWRLVFPDTGATQWTFPGFLEGAQPATPINDKMTMDVTVIVSGKPTLS